MMLRGDLGRSFWPGIVLMPALTLAAASVTIVARLTALRLARPAHPLRLTSSYRPVVVVTGTGARRNGVVASAKPHTASPGSGPGPVSLPH